MTVIKPCPFCGSPFVENFIREKVREICKWVVNSDECKEGERG